MSYLNKTKIENILKKSNNNIVQYEDGKYFVTDGYCMWIDHNAEFFEEDRYLYKKTEVPEKERKNIKLMLDKLINIYLNEFDYLKADIEEKCKCKLVYETGKTVKCISLKKENWYKLIPEKYYNTFKKGCKFLIYESSPIVFVADKDDLLIGAISSLFVNNAHITY